MTFTNYGFIKLRLHYIYTSSIMYLYTRSFTNYGFIIYTQVRMIYRYQKMNDKGLLLRQGTTPAGRSGRRLQVFVHIRASFERTSGRDYCYVAMRRIATLLLAGPIFTAAAAAACSCTAPPVKGLALGSAGAKCATFALDHGTGHLSADALCLGPAGDGSVSTSAYSSPQEDL